MKPKQQANNLSPSLYSIETEEVLISALMISQAALDDVLDIIKPEMFYDARCKAIYEAILSLYDNSERIDLTIIANKLNQTNQLQQIGGYVYLSEVMTKVASSGHVQYHAMIVSQLYLRRNLIDILQRNLDVALNDFSVDVSTEYDTLYTELDHAMSAIVSNGMQPISERIEEARNGIYKRVESYRNNEFVGIPTGLTRLNKLTGGWQGNQLIVLAARPAMGKTALLLHFAVTSAKSHNPVCIYSLEMSSLSLLDRMIHRNTNIDPSVYKQGSMTNSELSEVEQSIHQLKSLPIYIDDKPSCNLRYIRTNAKMMHKQGKCKLILIDYLQIMDMSIEGRNREQEVANATRQLKKLAKELDVPIIALSQLSRSVESRHDKTPMLSDLRESGAIEQDADMVMFLFRPAYYNIDEINEDGRDISTENYGQLIMAKQREGALGTIEFSHNKSLTQIYDYDPKHSFESVPKQLEIDEEKKF